METCRICLKQSKLKLLLKFDEKKLKVFKETFKIDFKQNEIITKFICRICVKKLNNSHSFYKQLIEVQKKFNENFKENKYEDEQAVDWNTIVIKTEKDQIEENLIKEEKKDESNLNKNFGNFLGFESESEENQIEKVEETNEKHQKSNVKHRKLDEKHQKAIKSSSSTKLKKSKRSKAKSTKISSINEKDEKKSPVDINNFHKIIYKDENSSIFTDNYLQLNVNPSEITESGKLSLEAQIKFSSLKWSIFDWTCTEKDCNLNFANIVELNLHLKANHKSKYKTFCNQCGLNCFNLSSFVSHIIKYHNNNSRFSCIICSEIYSNLFSLYKHYKDEHKNYRIVMCLYCGLHFNTTKTLKNHLISNHNRIDDRNDFTCDICGLSLKIKETLASHMYMHMQSTKQICDACGAIFNRRGELQMHIKNVHTQVSEAPVCDCGKSFKSLLQLRRHKIAVHNKHLVPHNHICKICQKKFRTAYMLKCHELVHDPVSSRYTCPHCGKGFKYSSGFHYHVRSAHTNEKPYRCPACDLRFFDYANAQKHVKGVHGGELKPIKDGLE